LRVASGSEPTSYRISDDADQIRREHNRLHTLARVVDPMTQRTLEEIGVGHGWHCCDVGSGAGTVAAWMADRVGPAGTVVSLDVDTRFQPTSSGVIEVRTVDITVDPIGDAEFDLVHARGVLQHIASRGAVLDAMIRATKPGGWIVVTDTDWLQFDAQPVPEPFATLSHILRELSVTQHGYDGEWGRMLVHAMRTRGLDAVEGRGDVWIMKGGTDSAEWYVGALDRALAVLPPDVFPADFDPAAAIAQARRPDFAIWSPLSMTAWGRRPR
jgi:SAM-dependent methyltransferase